LRQPLRHEVILRLAGDIDEPRMPSSTVFHCFVMIEATVRSSQMIAVSFVRRLVLTAVRDAIWIASHADRIPLRAALLLVRESASLTIDLFSLDIPFEEAAHVEVRIERNQREFET